MSMLNPYDWPRTARRDITLEPVTGLYALFLRPNSVLPGIEPCREGLIYIGKAAGKRGLLGRCHFAGKTRNHSPRKSLAYLLRDQLKLTATYLPKPNSPPTWGLDTASEERLSLWMHENLLLAVTPNPQPAAAEKTLIAQHAPPLNLDLCFQTHRHEALKAGRSQMLEVARQDRSKAKP